MDKNKSIIPTNKPPIQGGLFSDIYNIETFVHFSDIRKGLKDQIGSFIQVNHRIKNIELYRKLNNCFFKDHKTIKKIKKALFCCSTISKIEICNNNSAAISRTSQKCRRSSCSRCNQIRSGQYRSRFYKAFLSSENSHLFKKKYFYFITLTVKHNTKGCRTEVYLQELKTYVKKLKRSKLWKKHFPYSKKNPVTGFAESYEMTLTPNGYHIHSHIMICTNPIRIKARKLEILLRWKWRKITKDSTGVRFDMLKIGKKEIQQIKAGFPSSKFNGLIMEVFKYTVKLGNVHKLNKHNTNLFANWLIETKEKNMIVAGGFFRGMQLFGRDSKWDNDKPEKIGNSPDFKYLVGRTSQIRFNHNAAKDYPKEGYTWKNEYTPSKSEILETVFLNKVPDDFVDISRTGDFFDLYLNLSIDPTKNRWGKSDIDRTIRWAISCELKQAEKQFYEDMQQPLDQDFINQANLLYLNPNIHPVEETEQLHFQF